MFLNYSTKYQTPGREHIKSLHLINSSILHTDTVQWPGGKYLTEDRIKLKQKNAALTAFYQV